MEDLQRGRCHLRVIKGKSGNKWPSSGGYTADAAHFKMYLQLMGGSKTTQFVSVKLKGESEGAAAPLVAGDGTAGYTADTKFYLFVLIRCFSICL